MSAAALGQLGVSFALTGDRQLDAAFVELPKRVQKKVLREGLRPAAKVVQGQAKSNIPKRSGRAAESLKVRAGKRSRANPDRVSVLVITAAGWFKGDQYYLAFGELGFKLGSRKAYTFPAGLRYKLGKSRWLKQRIPVGGKHWIKGALDTRRAEATALAQQKIAEGIEREAASLGKSV